MPPALIDAPKPKDVRTREPEMVWIEGGTFRMGSDHHYPEEGPVHAVRLDGFWIDRFPVTNREFARFVEETGYVTSAEVAPRQEDYPEAASSQLHAGSLVFTPLPEAAARDWQSWWALVDGADWRHPAGRGSDLAGRMDHPVVHVTWSDAARYAAWRRVALPSEAEWEYAARGGLDQAEYAWGDAFAPAGVHRANTWQGHFPHENLAEDGFVGTSPVDAFPANGFGISDMIGNVWEWTDDWYQSSHAAQGGSCCVRHNPRGGEPGASLDPAALWSGLPRKVLKGGSHLCAPNYCRRYRPAARAPQTIDTSSSHIGFRCLRRLKDASFYG